MKNKNACNDSSFLECTIGVDVGDIFLLTDDIIQLLFLLLTVKENYRRNRLLDTLKFTGPFFLCLFSIFIFQLKN